MAAKYKVSDVAKDFKVSNKDIISLLEERFGTVKKSVTALTEEELNVIMEHFTHEHEVGSFDEYFASANKPREEKKPEPEQKPKPEQKKPEQKKDAPRQEKKPEQKAQQNNGGNNSNSSNNKNQNGKPRSEQKPQPAESAKPQNPQARKSPYSRFENAQPLQKQGSKPQKQQKPQQKQKSDGQTITHVAGLASETPRAVTHVDMRASNVDLDKYNEKYEQIAPANVRDSAGVKKQKLTQKSAQRGKPQYSRKEQEAQKLRKLELERQRRQKLEITLPDELTVGELAGKLNIASAEIIKRLMQMGTMASVNEVIDYDTAALVAMDIGAKVSHEVVVTIEDRLIDDSDDDSDALVERSPVVVVMGHVDHGKTSLLDAIRNAHVTDTEAGGITQHIGAYRVMVNGKYITFLDTPGHEAFTSMRARGAQVTDIAILVVAADDGIMPQTVEAINHAKAAEVSIIVAINKMDKPHANPDRVKQQLMEYGLVPEEWGGDVICVPVSAKTHENIDMLLEMVQLTADVKELKSNPDRRAKGTIIEARLDKNRGPIATVLVQNGTLRTGDVVIAGTTVCKVRTMTNDRGERVESAGPSVPVEITGLDEVPEAGDVFNGVEDERLARELAEQRRYEAKQEKFKEYHKVTLDNLFSQIAEGDMKELPLVVKADVQGSVEAVRQSLEKLSNDEVRVKVIHGAVGAISKSDVMLADASNAIIIGFNVRPDPVARDEAETKGVDMRLYRVIYDAIEEIKSAMKGMLAPKYRDVDLGRAEVRMVYRISNVGVVAGCYVTEGKITRNANIRVVRDGIIIADDKLDSLKRFKDDVKEVASGYECGMALTKYSDIREGDVFEAYEVEEYRD